MFPPNYGPLPLESNGCPSGPIGQLFPNSPFDHMLSSPLADPILTGCGRAADPYDAAGETLKRLRENAFAYEKPQSGPTFDNRYERTGGDGIIPTSSPSAVDVGAALTYAAEQRERTSEAAVQSLMEASRSTIGIVTDPNKGYAQEDTIRDILAESRERTASIMRAAMVVEEKPQPIVNVFGQVDNSHLTYITEEGRDPGWHVTTQLSRMHREGSEESRTPRLSVHDYLDDFR